MNKEIDNNWTLNFFKAVAQNWGGREYRCLTCGHTFATKDGKELSEKAVEHLRGNCKIKG